MEETFNKDESLWFVQILVEALTTGQNAVTELSEDNIAHQTFVITVQVFLLNSCIDFPG